MWAERYYCHFDDLKQWMGDDTAHGQEPYLLYCIEAASRAIDKATERQFGHAEQARVYTAEWDRSLCRWTIDTDDLRWVTEIAADLAGDGSFSHPVDDYTLTPHNAAQNHRPYTRIVVNPSSANLPNDRNGAVRVTGHFGWLDIPAPIRLATMIQAARLWERREGGTGPLTSKEVDDVKYQWGAATELDVDLLTMVAPFVRHWAAV